MPKVAGIHMQEIELQDRPLTSLSTVSPKPTNAREAHPSTTTLLYRTSTFQNKIAHPISDFCLIVFKSMTSPATECHSQHHCCPAASKNHGEVVWAELPGPEVAESLQAGVRPGAGFSSRRSSSHCHQTGTCSPSGHAPAALLMMLPFSPAAPSQGSFPFNSLPSAPICMVTLERTNGPS